MTDLLNSDKVENEGHKSSFIPERHFMDRAETTQEIISRRPSFLEKWTLIIFLFIILLIIGGSWFVKYPDTIEANAVLTSENAPKEILARKGGKLVSLFKKNNEMVRNGEIIGWLESNASNEDVLHLSQCLDKCSLFLQYPDSILPSEIGFEQYANLGEIQVPYQTFNVAWQQFSDYILNGFFQKKQKMLSEDTASLRAIKNKTETQRILSVQDTELARKTFEMNEILYKQKVLSTEEYRQAQSKLLGYQKTIPQADVTIISQQNQIREKEKEIIQIKHDKLQQWVVFTQALHTMRSIVIDWIRIHTIQAPTEGQIVFVLPLQTNQYVTQGKILGYVNPSDSKYYAEIRLPQSNIGKVDTGMNVQLRFDAYPYQEIGFVPAKLSYISKIAVDSGFLGTARLDQGLITSIRKYIQYKNGLKARAIIITKNMRLLERLYNSVSKSMELTK